jgi:arylsulfatase A-like enzyme
LPVALSNLFERAGVVSSGISAHIVHEATHIVDIAATIYDAAGVEYPGEIIGNELTPLEGHSFQQAIKNGNWVRPAPIFWEHEGNRAVRLGDWKLVSEGNTVCELYNMKADRTELNDLSDEQPEVLARLVDMYESWSTRVGALPWPVVPEVTASPRIGTKHFHDVEKIVSDIACSVLINKRFLLR